MHFALSSYAFDDAYIHFRIAENYLKNGEPYFNQGENILVTSSILYTIILTALFMLFGVGITGPILLNAVVLPVSCYFFARLACVICRKESVLLEMLVALIVFLLAFQASAGLMETPLCLLLVGWGLLLYCLGYWQGLSLLALSIFVRLETAPLFALTVAHAFFVSSFQKRTIFKGFAFGFFPLFFWQIYFFETLTPSAVAAKKKVYSLTLFETLSFIKEHVYSDFVVTIFPQFLIGHFFLLTAFAIFYLFSRCPAVIKKENFAFVPFFWGVSVACAYAFSGSLVFPWYHPLYSVPIFFSLIVFAFSFSEKQRNLLLTTLVVPVLLVHIPDLYFSLFDKTCYAYFQEGARVRKYLELGEKLRKEHPQAKIMASEIGGLGFAFKGYIYDAVGIASPPALEHHPLKIPEQRESGMLGSIPTDYALRVRPDIIVSIAGLVENNFQERLKSDYKLEETSIFIEQDMLAHSNPNVWGHKIIQIYYLRSEREKL